MRVWNGLWLLLCMVALHPTTVVAAGKLPTCAQKTAEQSPRLKVDIEVAISLAAKGMFHRDHDSQIRLFNQIHGLGYFLLYGPKRPRKPTEGPGFIREDLPQLSLSELKLATAIVVQQYPELDGIGFPPPGIHGDRESDAFIERVKKRFKRRPPKQLEFIYEKRTTRKGMNEAERVVSHFRKTLEDRVHPINWELLEERFPPQPPELPELSPPSLAGMKLVLALSVDAVEKTTLMQDFTEMGIEPKLETGHIPFGEWKRPACRYSVVIPLTDADLVSAKAYAQVILRNSHAIEQVMLEM